VGFEAEFTDSVRDCFDALIWGVLFHDDDHDVWGFLKK
jgi:hypothetical protein